MNSLVYVVVCIAGLFFLSRNLKFIRNEALLRAYLLQSPKAALWIKTLGEERTVKLARVLFLPLGLVVSLCLALGGGALAVEALMGTDVRLP